MNINSYKNLINNVPWCIKYIPKKEFNTDFINDILYDKPDCYQYLDKKYKKFVKRDFIIDNYEIIYKHLIKNHDLYIELYQNNKNNLNFFPEKQKNKILKFSQIKKDKILNKDEFNKLLNLFL